MLNAPPCRMLDMCAHVCDLQARHSQREIVCRSRPRTTGVGGRGRSPLYTVCSIKSEPQTMQKSNLLKVFPMFVWIYQNMHFFFGVAIFWSHTHPLLKLFLHTQWEAARCSCRARVSSSKTPGCVEWMMSAVDTC